MKKVPLVRRTPLRSKGPGLKRSPLLCKTGLPYPARKTKLKQVSAKRRKEGAEYTKLRKAFLKEHPKCQVCLCRTAVERVDVRPATEVHHKGGRGKLLLRVDTWLAVCHHHHEQITESRQWAESCGWSLTVAERRAL
jgi:hypothetical protein